jgi:hypothetical protein
MPDGYAYEIERCDVPKERRRALQSYRGKRRLWLQWLETDEHHAIWRVLSEMIWKEVAFRTLTGLAMRGANALNNPMLAEALLEGHVATQVLAIRRLMDDSGSGVISLRRLLKDMRANVHLFTRENYVCFDGSPYDYRTVPEADGMSEFAHIQFDILAGVAPDARSRLDRLPVRLFETIERWCADSGANDLADWSSTYLAHAGGPEWRERIAPLRVTAYRIGGAIWALARTAEAMTAWLLNAGGRSGGLMPVAQFNQFESLDQPIVLEGGEAALRGLWDHHSRAWRDCLDFMEYALVGRASLSARGGSGA